MATREDRPVLGKMRFRVSHHEPDLSPAQRAERMQTVQNELYAVFSDMQENKDKRMIGKQDDNMV